MFLPRGKVCAKQCKLGLDEQTLLAALLCVSDAMYNIYNTSARHDQGRSPSFRSKPVQLH